MRDITNRLAGAGVPSPRADAELLAAHALRIDRNELARRIALGFTFDDAGAPGFSRGENSGKGDDGDDGVYACLQQLAAQRANRVPLQHLTGRAPFRQLELMVGPGVFIPRPETELVAGAAIEYLRANSSRAGQPLIAVDLCAGSAAIAIAIASECPGVNVHAVELDPAAARWAWRNIRELAPQVNLTEGDAANALPELDGQVDVVASNPPYIPAGATPQQPEAARHDPPLALYGPEPDGLGTVRAVVVAATRLLKPAGLLVLEHGEPQAAAIAQMLAETERFTNIESHRDLAGRPRFVTAVRR